MPCSELVKLREAKPARVVNEHHRRIRHVDAHLDLNADNVADTVIAPVYTGDVAVTADPSDVNRIATPAVAHAIVTVSATLAMAELAVPSLTR